MNVFITTRNLFDEEGITFSLKRGERVCIEGPSGIGKTRFLRTIAKLDELQSGSISFIGGGESINFSFPKWRSRCIYIPQALPPMENTPKEFVREACCYKSRVKRKGSIELLENFNEYCLTIANSVGLEASKMDQLWRELSGGERQRALIACALLLIKAATITSADEPLNCVLLLDEPTAACDQLSAALVEAAIIESKATVLMITHDDRQSKRFAHRSLNLIPVSMSTK